MNTNAKQKSWSRRKNRCLTETTNDTWPGRTFRASSSYIGISRVQCSEDAA